MFDPYHKWLGIPPQDQPPNHYRLLGLQNYEKDLDVVEGAADRAMGFVRQYQSSDQAAAASKLLNEIAAARLCLLKPASKSEYDAKLRKQLTVIDESKTDDLFFANDAEIAELTKSSRLVPKKTKRKKKSSLPPIKVLVGGGIGVVAIVLLIVISTQKASNPPLLAPPEQATPKPAISSSGIPDSTTAVDFKLSQQAVGPAVDLIQAVDLTRDLLSGEWKKEGPMLIGSPGGKLYLPINPPDDYSLKMTVKRTGTTDALIVGFVMTGRQGMVGFDVANSTISGMMLDGSFMASNCVSRPGALFRNDQVADISFTIHPGHLMVKVDGQSVIDWYGKPERIACQVTGGMPNRESLYLIAHSNYRIESAKLIPIAPEPVHQRVFALDSEVDLSPLIEIPRDARTGTWAMDQGVLSSPGNFAQLQIPVEVPEEYTLSATVERPQDSKGEAQLSFGLVAGTSICQVVPFSHYAALNTNCLGIDSIDGIRWHANATHLMGYQLALGESANVAFTVTKRGIRYDLNGRTLIDWCGDPRRLGLTRESYLADARKLFLASHSNYRFRNLKIGPPVRPPGLPVQPILETGHPVDLIPLVVPKRDTLGGTWTVEGNKLRVMGDVTFCKLLIPCKLPSEYKFTIRVSRDGGPLQGLMALNLPADDRIVQIIFDQLPSEKKGLSFSGVHLDDFAIETPENPLRLELKTFPTLQAVQDIVVFVRRSGLKIQVGKTAVVDWVGDFNRFGTNLAWTTPPGGIGICSLSSRFRFDKLEIEPLESTPLSAVKQLGVDGNLVAIIDPARDSQKGDWKLDQNGLYSPGIRGARICLPSPPPERYVLSTNVERKSGSNELMLGLVCGKNPCAAIIDGKAGTHSGISQVDGLPFSDDANQSRRRSDSPLLPVGKSVHVQCFVLPGTVVVKCDDKEVIRYHGDGRRLSLERFYPPPVLLDEDHSQLWLGGQESEFLFRDLTLKPLSDAEAERIANNID